MGSTDTLTETFTYIVSDGKGGTDAAELTITVNGVNDVPVASDDNKTTSEDTAVTIDVSENDTDVEDGTPTGEISIVDQPTNGTVEIDDNGTPDDKSDDQVIYTPSEDFVGKDTFTYTVTDSEGVTSDPATVTVTVEEVNDEPVAVDDTETTSEDTPVTIDVVENDTDVEDETPTGEISIVEQPSKGTVEIDDNGTPGDKSDDQVIYTPDEDFTGEDTFTYTVDDSDGVTSDPATVTVTVDPVNDTPVANDDGASTDKETPVTIDVSDNDTDAEDEVPTGEITITSEPSKGTVEIDDNGTPDDQSDDQVIYTPNTDFVGTDTFTYTINDSDGTPSNEAEVIVSVGGVNNQAVAEDDAVITPEDTPVTVNVSENDTDVEDVTPTGEITIINQPENGTVEIDDNDTPDDFSDDLVIYTPDENYSGEDTFTYTIDDSEGKPSNTATVTVSIDPAVNDAPIANDYNEVTPEDTPVTLDVVKNDTDVEDGVPTGVISIIDQPTNGTVEIDDKGTSETSDDEVVYTPNSEFNGTDTFTYTVEDSEGTPSDPATVMVNVESINDTPVAEDDSVTTPENTPVTIDVDKNDTDVEDGIPTGVISIIDQPTNGSVEIDDKGTPETSDDEVIYTPNSEFNGTDTFTYTIEDSEGLPSSVATVTVTVDDLGNPIAEDDGTTTPADTPVTINVVENDTDDGEVLPESLAIVDNPANGTITVNEDGTVEYTPNAAFVGEDTFTYTVTDDQGNVSEPATVTIVVQDPTQDTDEDGIPDVDDLDDDNDSIPDTEDGPGDTDGDGIPDIVDLDSDNDGIPDLVESGLPLEEVAELDTDGDGVIDPNYEFGDNGLADVVETTPESGELDLDGDGIADDPIDTDGDDVPDFQDLDSDNDGLNDITEAGNPDENGDGIIDDLTDTDGDGLADQVDPDNGGTSTTPPDIDNDGALDFRDLDSDNDGLADLIESGLDPETVDPDGDGIIEDPDTDEDGIPDVVDGEVDTFGDGNNSNPPDTDEDGTPDYQEIDSDGDGTPDRVEAELPTGVGTPDENGDGIIDDPTDTDKDGIPDTIDSALGTDGGFESPDTDKDGIPDVVDLDDDNDGIPDEVEGDGDTDGDGVPDIVDLDSDNDGISDLDESGLSPEEIAALDSNNDGVIDPENELGDNGLADLVETTPDSGELDQEPVDTDSDNVPDFKDLDSDNDGLNDIEEAGLDDPEGDGIVNGSDTDGDGIPDGVDATNGFGDQNPNEPDTDADNVPDYRDLDSDNDGVSDLVEGGLDPEVVDPDGNGIIEAGDRDEDGIPDAVDGSDGFSDDGDQPAPDADNDGTPDYQELDSDGDGTPDRVEAGLPTGEGTPDVDGDGEIDDPTDSDGDGVPDAIDTAPGTDGGFESTDTDKDGIPDGVDLDDDNDGIPDEVEGDGDTDGDGVPDIIDLDSDNDGIADIVESGLTPEQIAELDTDGDGVIDPSNEFGENGILDRVETTPDSGELDLNGDGIIDDPTDTDTDGIPDFQDLDSDNDGINDITESGNPDENGDGIIDDLSDTDGDGLADAVDPDNGGILTTPVDADGDNAPDFRDLDSDNDGINDILEGGLADPDGDGVVNGSDNDGDGILAQADPNDNRFGDNGVGAAPDTDNDGTPDYQDLDSDNDGENDIEEAGLADPDGDGRINGSDSDGDGIPDPVDQNNDGFGDTPSGDIPNSDGDGVPDFRDVGVAPVATDDSITTVSDAQITIAVLDNDTDADGDSLSIASFEGITQLGGTVIQDGNTLVYTPVAGSSGIDTFSYTITDGNGGTDTATVTVTLENGVVVSSNSNNAPVANDDNPNTPQDTAVSINVLENDTDTDGNATLDLNSVVLVSEPSNGILVNNENGIFTYTPNGGYVGQDTFSYTVADIDGNLSNTATVSISVDPLGNAIVDCCDCITITAPELGHYLLPERPTVTEVNLEGTINPDLLGGSNGDDTFNAFSGNDTLVAEEGDDLGYTAQGDDLFFADMGNDVLFGELGNDTLIAGPSGTQPIGDSGDQDLVFGDEDNDWLIGSLGMDTLHSGQGDDHAFGGKDDDWVMGELGNDTLSGDQGDDTLLGGTSNDANDPVRDVSGLDLLFGGAGNDWMDGNEANDTLVGGEGDDTVYGGQDQDLLFGEAGNDYMLGDIGNDTLVGGEGDDTLRGDQTDNGNSPAVGANGQQDKLSGGAGNDLLFGDEGQDTLCGGEGNDTLHGGKDNDLLKACHGNDLLLGEEGDDTLIAGEGNSTLTGGEGNDSFVLNLNSGSSFITDFQLGQDRLVLGESLTVEQLQITQEGNNTSISLNNQLLATLEQVNVDELTNDSFI